MREQNLWNSIRNSLPSPNSDKAFSIAYLLSILSIKKALFVSIWVWPLYGLFGWREIEEPSVANLLAPLTCGKISVISQDIGLPGTTFFQITPPL